MTTTQALILAGGLGSRLGAITREMPKPMVSIGGRPFLEWQIALLARHGITRFLLCVSYRARQIQDYFRDGKKFRCDIRYSVEDTPLGTGGAIRHASGLLDETFFVLSGDNFLTLDYQDYIAAFHRARTAVGQLACWANEPELFQSNVDLDGATRAIRTYDYQNPSGKKYVDIGVKIFSRKLLSYFPAGPAFSLEKDVMPALAQKGLLVGYPVDHPPLDIGTPEGLAVAAEQLLPEGPAAHA